MLRFILFKHSFSTYRKISRLNINGNVSLIFIFSIVSDNKLRVSDNNQTLSHSTSNLLRRSFGRLPFVFSNEPANTEAQLIDVYDDTATGKQDESLGADDRMEPSRTCTKGGGLLQVSNINLSF